MKLKKMLFFMCCTTTCMGHAQSFDARYTTEWQWDMKKKTNWVNLLILEVALPLWRGGSLEAATIHIAKTDEHIIDDRQGFSNIEEENDFASIAVLGYMHTWEKVHLFVGVRNVNKEFFTSDITSLFTNSSCGIFPTISASYPIANYPLSGLTVYFDVNFGGWVFKNSLYNGKGYNGWNRQDNPFLVRLKKDGIFDMAQLEYEYKSGHYFAGIAVHSRWFPVDEEREIPQIEASPKKTSCAWWVYFEQPVWTNGKKELSFIAQYSENTYRKNGCYRYGEIGCVYDNNSNRFGLSGQYARFSQDKELSAEMTWNKTINKSLSIQPSFQYISNENGHFTVLCARVYYNF